MREIFRVMDFLGDQAAARQHLPGLKIEFGVWALGTTIASAQNLIATLVRDYADCGEPAEAATRFRKRD